jgi:DNA-binding MarR family transcriptional regulator
MSKKGKGGYRKDGRDRRKLTLSVTPESIEEARKVDRSLSRAFEKVFRPQPE